VITVRALSILAALALAGAAYAQTTPPQNSSQANTPASPSSDNAGQPSPDTTAPSSASSPSQRDVTSSQGVPEATPNQNPNPSAASSPHQRDVTRMATANAGAPLSAGMMVQDSSGRSLGSVGDVIPGKSGKHGYVVVTAPDGTATPLPYSVASSMAKDGKIVVDRSAFEAAPKVQQSDIENHDMSWRNKTDKYWKKHTG